MGLKKNLNNLLIIFFIKAIIISSQKKFSQLLSGSVNLLASNLAYKVLWSILLLKDSESANKVLNNINIDGILTRFLNSVLFNKASTITHNWDGFKKIKNLYVKVNNFL